MTSADTPIGIGEVIDRRYRLLGVLGRGGFGVVYKAEQLATGQSVAIKLLSTPAAGDGAEDAHIARFEREMRVVGRLAHPNIVRLVDSGWVDERFRYIALEFVRGEPLSTLIERSGPLPLAQAVRVMRQVAEALAYAHGQGVVHRDLKPANIMVTEAGSRCNATVLDFGIVHLVEEARGEDYRTLTARGELAGTPSYMAPEQLLHGTVSPSSDLYTWGAVFVEALTGERAVVEKSLARLVLRYRDLERLVSIPEEYRDTRLGQLLFKATEVDADKRYQTAEEALADLERLNIAGVDTATHGASAERLRWRPTWLAAGVLVGALAMAVTWSALSGTEPAAAVAAGDPEEVVEREGENEAPDMLVVDAGPFLRGCVGEPGDCPADEVPARELQLGAFEIDRAEVTVADYSACVDATVCQLSDRQTFEGACNWDRPDREEHPVNCVTWHEAQMFCEWLGKRLPTEAEWERAARGVDGRTFPWGEELASCDRAVMGLASPDCLPRTTRPTGWRPAGMSAVGAYDMAGNVAEWTRDWYVPDYYAESPGLDPVGPTGGRERSVRGGGFADPVAAVRATARAARGPFERRPDIGFRCVRSIED